MISWPSTKARRVYAALLSVGWQLNRQFGVVVNHGGRTVLAMNCVPGGAESAQCVAAQLKR